MSEETPMMSVLRDVEGPPGGWTYTVPQTGIVLKATYFQSLWSKTAAHLRANGHEVDEDYRAVVEHGACLETPLGKCGKRKEKPVATGHPVPLLGAMNAFIRSIWGSLQERRFVPREEAERRAAICAGCEFRVHRPGGCGTCYTLLSKATDLMEKNPIKFEPDEDGTVRDVCGACLCLIPVKAWLLSSVLDKAEGDRKPLYAPGCWRLEK